MLGWLKVIQKKFKKLSSIKQFMVAAVIIISIRYLLKTIIYTNNLFGYLEGLKNPTNAIYFPKFKIGCIRILGSNLCS